MDSNVSVDQERRSFLLRVGAGLGYLTLADLSGVTASAQSLAAVQPNTGLPGLPHHQPRAKRIIYLHMMGAVSQPDTFDFKPTLKQMHGQELPPSVRGKVRLSTMVAGQSSFPIVGPIAEFQPRGESGMVVSDLLPHIGGIVDEITLVRSMYTEHVNHDPASKFLHTGFQIAGRPSIGSWVTYALGSENKDLPMFVVLSSGVAGSAPSDAAAWSAGFVPSHYQGVQFRSGAAPVAYIANPPGVSTAVRRQMLDRIMALARSQQAASGDGEITSKIAQYEMANRMQSSVPQIADITSEPQHVLDLYGPDVTKPATFARNCLLARRLAERDVRHTMLIHMGWDHHAGIARGLPQQCAQVDQPIAGLIRDLRQRGLLEDTLVVFSTEFGRTAFAQGELKSSYGRDHHGGCFSIWMAGGGVKAGYVHGTTDDFCYTVVKDGVHVHDLNATILHLLGVDHERLTYRSQGRDFRLTDVGGRVQRALLA
jgi:hypothetical protein